MEFQSLAGGTGIQLARHMTHPHGWAIVRILFSLVVAAALTAAEIGCGSDSSISPTTPTAPGPSSPPVSESTSLQFEVTEGIASLILLAQRPAVRYTA